MDLRPRRKREVMWFPSRSQYGPTVTEAVGRR